MRYAGSYHRQQRKESASQFLWPVVLGLIWISMVVLANPIGDFPLNDGWAYGYSVQDLVQKGELRFSDWTGPNLLGQVLWGALFCLPFGFSFTALRFSSAVLGFVGVLATYGILRELKTSRQMAAIGALTLACCPIYFALSLTFMTDVPFAAFAIASLYFFIRGMRTESRLTIAVSFLLASVAILIRQNGLALPAAFACALLAKKGIKPRYVLLALVLVASGIGIQFAYQTWLFKNGLAAAQFNSQVFSLLRQTRLGGRQLLRESVRISFFCLMYLGLFTAPLLPLLVMKAQRDRQLSSKKTLVATALILMLLTAYLIRVGELMPLWRNILEKGGVGPYAMMKNETLRAPGFVLVAVTGLTLLSSTGVIKGLVSAGVGVYSRLRTSSVGCRPWILILLFSVLAISFAPLPLLGLTDPAFCFYDRYVIIFVPLTIAILATIVNETSVFPISSLATGIAFLLVGLYALFSVAATHDYLAINRTRWTAFHDLMREVPPSHISGGVDFNGWYFYNRYSKDPNRKWFWFERDDYFVAFYRFDNCELIRQYPVERWLPWKHGAGAVLVERRIAGDPRSE
jgi:4-amino-4-deoxy-L-arabinose transferase-like glycosyltransferase